MLLGGVLLLYFVDGFARRGSLRRAASSALDAARAARRGVAPRRRAPRSRSGFSAVLVAISWLPAFPRAVGRDCIRPRACSSASFDGWVGTDQKIDWMFYGTAGFGQIVEPPLRARQRRGRGVHRPGSGAMVARAAISRRRPAIRAAAGSPSASERDRIAGREATLRVLRKGATRVLAVSWFEASPGLAVESARALLALDSTALLDREPDSARGPPRHAARERRRSGRSSRAGSGSSASPSASPRPCRLLVDPAGILACWETVFSIERKSERVVPSAAAAAKMRIVY